MPTSKEHPVEGPPEVPATKVHETVKRDPFYLSEKRRKEYGITENEEPYWARDAAYWAQYEQTDRQAELMADPEDGGVGARLVYKNGEFDKVRIGGEAGDLVLMAVPKAVKEQQQREVDAAHAHYQHGMVHTDDGFETDEEIFDRRDLKKRMRAEHMFHEQANLVGGNSPTAGMTYMEAAATMQRRGVDIAARQERLRMGGQHTEVSAENFTRLITGQSKLFGMGDSGLGKTTAQKLAARGGR